MSKLLIIFRLYDPTYGLQGNSKTLSVCLREDNTLGYSYYGGWQDSGSGFSISNMQLKKSLPINAKLFKTTKKLCEEITSVLSTGVGSRKISSLEILNEIGTKSIRTKKLSDMNAEIERLAKSINRMEKELDTFDQKILGSSAREDLHSDIIRLKKKLADKVLSFYKK